MAYRSAHIGKEICPSFADALKELEGNTDSLSGLSKEVEHRNFKLLLENKFKQESITNLVHILNANESIKNRYPLGKFGAAQVVDHAVSMM